MNNSRIKTRAHIIGYIYSCLVLDTRPSGRAASESGHYSDQEVKIIGVIEKNLDKYQLIIKKYLKPGWTWERINSLEKAILIFGAFELNVNDKALVINELVVISRGYIPGDAYKFINAILNKIGDLYASRN